MKSLLLGAAALAMTASFAAADVVRMGTEGAYPPYNFLNDAGEVDGFERELGDELCKRAELTCEWVTNDWDSIIPNLVSGNYDTIMAGMSITAERDQVIDFTTNYIRSDPSAYAGLSEGMEISGAVIAAQASTIQAAHISTLDATLVEFATPEESMAAVRNGEADMVLADKSYLEPFVAEDANLFWSAPDVVLGEGIGLGLRESDGELKEKFNVAIESMKADGTLNALIEKWLPGAQLF